MTRDCHHPHTRLHGSNMTPKIQIKRCPVTDNLMVCICHNIMTVANSQTTIKSVQNLYKNNMYIFLVKCTNTKIYTNTMNCLHWNVIPNNTVVTQ